MLADLAAHLAEHWDAWWTALVLLLTVGVLIHGRYAADLAFMGAVAMLLLATEAAVLLPQSWGLSKGPLDADAAVRAFAAKTVVTVGMLYIVAEGMRQTGAMSLVVAAVMGRPRGVLEAQARLTGPVALLSAFVNNTPIVAMFLPVLDGMARRSGIRASQLYMPLSFASILGGVCTLIGTSTNLVVAGELENAGLAGPDGEPLRIGMFTLSLVGVPVCIAGLAYMLAFGRRLLPGRITPAEAAAGESTAPARQYTAAMRIPPGSPLAGRTVDGAGLRHLPGLFLSRIDRGEDSVVAVGPQERLREDDVLIFVGDVEAVVELQQIRGLEPVGRGTPPTGAARPRLIEVVVAGNGSLPGRTIRDAAIRTRFGAVVVAVHRAGQRLTGRIGDIRLRAGDVLMLEAPTGFGRRFRDSADFYMVQEREEPATLRHERALIAMGVLAFVVVGIASGLLGPMTASTIGAGLMIATRCCTGPEARRSVQWSVLVVIASAFAVASALASTGLAAMLADAVVRLVGGLGPHALLAGIYLATSLLTMAMTNNAAAALMFPLSVGVAASAGLNPMPFAIAVAIAASCEFSSPIGYQTNLMVMGPGGYRWLDFTRFGLPLNAIAMAITIGLGPLVYGGL